MAHAGTPTDLAKQPIASSSWNNLLTAIVILAIGVGMVLAVPFITGGRASTGPAVDRSYDLIETQRGATTLSGVSVDTSNAVQKAAAAKARAMSGVAVDTSYDAVENLRAQSGVTVDTSYDAAEKARAAAGAGTKIDPTTFDRTPRGAHGMLP